MTWETIDFQEDSINNAVSLKDVIVSCHCSEWYQHQVTFLKGVVFQKISIYRAGGTCKDFPSYLVHFH